jgi:hypothetical protein
MRRIIPKNHRNTTAQVRGQAELNIYLEDRVSTKTVRREHCNPKSTVGLQPPDYWKSVNDGVMTIRTWHQRKRKSACNMVKWVILHAILYNRKSLRLNERMRGGPSRPLHHDLQWSIVPKSLRFDNTQGSAQPGIPGSNHETWGESLMVWAGISWCNILLVTLWPFIGRITAREYVDRLGN